MFFQKPKEIDPLDWSKLRPPLPRLDLINRFDRMGLDIENPTFIENRIRAAYVEQDRGIKAAERMKESIRVKQSEYDRLSKEVERLQASPIYIERKLADREYPELYRRYTESAARIRQLAEELGESVPVLPPIPRPLSVDSRITKEGIIEVGIIRDVFPESYRSELKKKKYSKDVVLAGYLLKGGYYDGTGNREDILRSLLSNDKTAEIVKDSFDIDGIEAIVDTYRMAGDDEDDMPFDENEGKFDETETETRGFFGRMKDRLTPKKGDSPKKSPPVKVKQPDFTDSQTKGDPVRVLPPEVGEGGPSSFRPQLRTGKRRGAVASTVTVKTVSQQGGESSADREERIRRETAAKRAMEEEEERLRSIRRQEREDAGLSDDDGTV